MRSVSLAYVAAREVKTDNCTHATVDSDDKAHDGVAKNTGTDSHLPIEANCNHRRCYDNSALCNSTGTKMPSEVSKLTNFPIRHSPGVGHPVGYIRTPVPSSLRGRNWIKIGIGGTFRGGKTALLLPNLEAEARKTSLDHLPFRDRCIKGGSGWRAPLLLIVGRHGGVAAEAEMGLELQCVQVVEV